MVREWQVRNLKPFLGVDPAAARAEAERLLERVVRDFADVRQPMFLADGPGNIRLSRYASPEAKPKTYGALAEAALFELRNLAVGKPAPEIEGEDVDGRRFKLSDHRGKVIVLTFSGNWCGPCREMYPRERAARRPPQGPAVRPPVREHRPGPRDPAEIDPRGEITWPCWFDGGRDGPITSRWNVLSFPTVFVIDAGGIIREVGLRGDELDRAVERLLGEAG